MGAGEGYVGEAVQRNYPSRTVTLADVVDFHRAPLPFVQVEPGAALPFEDNAFDAVILYFVLHHTKDAELLLREAARVGSTVLVAESTYVGAPQHVLLRTLDHAANALRSGGLVGDTLDHRTHADWLATFACTGLRCTAVKKRGRFVHRQVFYRLEAE